MNSKSIQSLVTERYGLLPRNTWPSDIHRAVSHLSRKHHMSHSAYYSLAERDPAVLAEMLPYLVVEESFFFRHPEHFESLTSFLKGRLETKDNTHPIVIWSAGCSEGQEPYSIAMTIQSNFLPERASLVEIHACDISEHALARAAEAEYSDWSFRQVSPGIISRFFTPTVEGTFQLDHHTKKMVIFHQMSIRDTAMMFIGIGVDAIFYRNVSIYLTEQYNRDIFQIFSNVTRPAGRLFLGPSDTQPAFTDEQWLSLPGTSTYMFQGNNRLLANKSSEPAFTLPSMTVDEHFRLQVANDDWQFVLDPEIGAFEAADRGDRTSALQTAEELKNKPETKVKGHMLAGLIHFSEEDFHLAADEFRQAHFSDLNNAIATFWYAYSLQKSGEHRRSKIQWNRLITDLEEMPKDTVLSDGKTMVDELLYASMRIWENLQ